MTIDKELWTNYFEYLDNLRHSGITNMFGASPYLADAFDISKEEARKVLKAWMETFGTGEDSVEIRVQKVK